MKNTIWTVIAVITAIFPFVMVGYELAIKESITTTAVFGAIVLVLLVTVVAALMVTRSPNSTRKS